MSGRHSIMNFMLTGCIKNEQNINPGMLQAGGRGVAAPPRFWQIRRRRRAAAARRITTCPPRFLEFATCLEPSKWSLRSEMLKTFFLFSKRVLLILSVLYKICPVFLGEKSQRLRFCPFQHAWSCRESL